MVPVFNAIGRLALTNSTVLIIGESGTGKELVAESLHLNSKRSKNHFYCVKYTCYTQRIVRVRTFLDMKKVLLQGPIQKNW